MPILQNYIVFLFFKQYCIVKNKCNNSTFFNYLKIKVITINLYRKKGKKSKISVKKGSFGLIFEIKK